MEQTKRGTKECWKRQQHKELTRGSGMKANSYETRPESDVTEAARIGKLSGIGQEQRQLLNCEGEGYTGAEGRWNERDLDWRS